jgi:anti-sigma factor RsiW
MRCFSERTLQEYLDGEVSDTLRPRMGQHLTQCRACSLKLASLSAAKNLALQKLALLDPPEVPAAPVIMARGAGAKRPRAFSLAWLLGQSVRLPVAAVAMAFLFLAGLSTGLLLRGRSTPTPASRAETASASLYILSDKNLQAVPLSLDLSGYQPIAEPRVIMTQEVKK